MTIEELKENYKAETELEKEVLEIICDEVYTEDVIDWFNDLFRNGCISGMIGALVYFADTLAFVQRHSTDINELLSEKVSETGLSPKELFGERWEEEDVLCLDINNRNLLAWFAFEDIAYKIVRDLNLEDGEI